MEMPLLVKGGERNVMLKSQPDEAARINVIQQQVKVLVVAQAETESGVNSYS